MIGNGAVGLEHDVTSQESWSSVVAHIEDRFGRLDILVNNAGILIPGTIESTSLEDFRTHLAVHVEGTFLGCQSALPLMKKSGGGSIINMASVAALRGGGPYLAYTAAKGAILSMNRAVAAHCQDEGNLIRCNTLAPAAAETPMFLTSIGEAVREPNVPEGVLPLGAAMSPTDVAHLVVYLASDESRYITGGEFALDNGQIQRV